MSLESLYQRFTDSAGVSIDTRFIKPHQIFFGLKGPNFNGNEYAQEALSKGASYVVVDEVIENVDQSKVILVENSLTCLQNLSYIHRNNFKGKVIAITGTNGKTTTKELLLHVLSVDFKVMATAGNLNNHIGVPLTLLGMPVDLDYAIIEMGANKPGDIHELCEFASPDIGILTNIGNAHLEGFGNEENLLKTKLELFDALIYKGGVAFCKLENEGVLERAKKVGTYFTFDSNGAADMSGNVIKNDPFLRFSLNLAGGRTIIQSRLTGSYNLHNFLAAALVSKYLGVNDAAIKSALEGYVPKMNRSQVVEYQGAELIMDAYNANPTSTLAAIKSLKDASKPIGVILGDMFELGATEELEHANMIHQVEKIKPSWAIFIGERYFKHKNAMFKYYRSVNEAKPEIEKMDMKGMRVLLKGSRGIGLEKLIQNG